MIKWFKRKKRKSEVDIDQEIEQLKLQKPKLLATRWQSIAVSAPQEPAPTPEPESPPPAPDTQLEEGWQENLILAETKDQAGSLEPEANLNTARIRGRGVPSPSKTSPVWAVKGTINPYPGSFEFQDGQALSG